jgi:hypothetical protein
MLRIAGFKNVSSFWYKPYPIFNTELLNRDKPISPQTELFLTRVYTTIARLRGKNHMETSRWLAIGYLIVADKHL